MASFHYCIIQYRNIWDNEVANRLARNALNANDKNPTQDSPITHVKTLLNSPPTMLVAHTMGQPRPMHDKDLMGHIRSIQ